jgi:PPP family 3-phenylpropionic acid transporter
VVFVLVGRWLLDVLGISASLALGAAAAAVRWLVMGQTANVTAIAAIEPLHGLTFALFHLSCMRIIAETVPRSLFGTAQALYGTVAIGGATAVLTMGSGWLFSRFGPYGFWGMAFLCCAAFPVIWSLRSSLRHSGR